MNIDGARAGLVAVWGRECEGVVSGGDAVAGSLMMSSSLYLSSHVLRHSAYLALNTGSVDVV